MAEIDVYKEWLGIPEGERPPDYYTLLRVVKFEDDIEKIQSNYRKLNAHVRKYATGQYLKQSQDLLNELAKAMLCLTDPVGKREYDESLGREFAEESEGEPRTVLEYLVANGVIKRGQISEIEHFADARGLSHRDAVVQMKLTTPEQASQALAAELRMSYVDLDDMLPEDSALDMLPRQVVKRHSCLPLFEDRGKILVACASEPSPELEDEVRLRFGMPMRAVLAKPRSIQQAIAKYYAPGARDESVAHGAGTAAGASDSAKDSGRKKNKPKPKTRVQDSSPEAKQRRQQISLLIILWSMMGTTLGSHFLGLMGEPSIETGIMSAFLGVVVAGIVAAVLKFTYWK